MRHCLLLLAVMTLLQGCFTRIGDVSAISTRNVSLERVNLENLPQTRNVTGKASNLVLVFIPLGVPHLEDAVEDALDKADGDLMLDASIHRGGWWFIIGETSIKVKGTVVNTRGGEQ